MIVLDGAVLGDYLAGRERAREFLAEYEDHEWAVPAIVVHEAYAAGVRSGTGDSTASIRAAVTASMEILDVTERTASEAAAIRAELLDRGIPVVHPELLVAAAAREHGGTLVTDSQHLHREPVAELVPVVEYDPD